MNFLTELHSKADLLDWYAKHKQNKVLKVNGHLHTPYSFCAFSDIAQIFKKAKAEDVKVLGINDFYVTDGYDDFYKQAVENKIFPLFNIEFIALSEEFQKNGIRVNDPNNPGRTYFSGKGLDYPFGLNQASKQQLDNVVQESMKQVGLMIEKLNDFLKETGISMRFSLKEIQRQHAKNLVRERHIAKAIRVEIFNQYKTDADKQNVLEKLFSGKKCQASLTDVAALENEIRANLLKAGGAAFVPEDQNAFLSVEQAKQIIINAGGIPCYPVLLDDKNGNYTDYEGNKEKMADDLESKNIYSIELIPGRNSFDALKEFVKYFDDRGFVITFGTEHNTPKMQPITVSCRNNTPLDNELLKINYKGACVVAAHQYLKAQGEQGYIDKQGNPAKNKLSEFITLGEAVIAKYIS